MCYNHVVNFFVDVYNKQKPYISMEGKKDMYFDFIQNVIIPNRHEKVFAEAENLYSECMKAERNAKTYPDETVFAIRLALECLVKGLLIEDGNYHKRPNGREKALSSLMQDYKISCSFLDAKKINKLNTMRSEVNKYFHTVTNDNGETSTLLIKHPTVEEAVLLIIDLYDIVTTIFNEEKSEFDADKLPIGEYTIEEKMPAAEYDSVAGNYNFKGKNDERKEPTYAYIRPFIAKKDDADRAFNERDSDVQDVLKNMKPTLHIVRGTRIGTGEQNDIGYMAYDIRENTTTLERLICLQPISAGHLLNIIYQCAQGLNDLTTGKDIIHHRWIRPSCIFVTPGDDDYYAELGCFETAKIEYDNISNETVYNQIQPVLKTSFVHPALEKLNDVSLEQWEKGDVYSLAATLLYCINNEALRGSKSDKNNTTALRNNYSPDFCNEMDKILNLDSETVDMIPTMKDFCSLLEKELTKAPSYYKKHDK